MRVYNAVTSPMEGVPLFIPGAGVDTYTGELLGRSIARVDIAIEAVANELTPAIVFSGGKAEGAAASEAEAMDMYLTHHAPLGVPLPRRYHETESVRSIQNLAYSMPYLRRAGMLSGSRDLSLVTDAAHMPRLLQIASKVLPEAVNILPVLTSYKATEYDLRREKLARPITKATLLRLEDGAGPEVVLERERQIYDGSKRVVKRVEGVVRKATGRQR